MGVAVLLRVLHLSFYIDLFEGFILGFLEYCGGFGCLEPNGARHALVPSFLLDQMGSTIVAKELDTLGVALKAKFFGQKSNINVGTVTGRSISTNPKDESREGLALYRGTQVPPSVPGLRTNP